jgi:hypothetical protein
MLMQAGFRSLLLISAFLMSACAFYPSTSKLQDHADECNMATRSLDLDYEDMSANACAGVGAEGGLLCLAGLGVIIPVGSLVASGSIVLVGNTLHWLEYHGTCDDGLLWSFLESSQ